MKNKCNNFETQNRILLLSNIYNLKKKKKKKKERKKERKKEEVVIISSTVQWMIALFQCCLII